MLDRHRHHTTIADALRTNPRPRRPAQSVRPDKCPAYAAALKSTVDDHGRKRHAIHALTIAAYRDAAHGSHTEHFIVDALRRAGQLSVLLRADDAGGSVGHVAISSVLISADSEGWFLGWSRSHRPSGSGHRGAAGVAGLGDAGAAGCVVLAEPGYYRRSGFNAESSRVRPE